jgi:hypothetical protein
MTRPSPAAQETAADGDTTMKSPADQVAAEVDRPAAPVGPPAALASPPATPTSLSVAAAILAALRGWRGFTARAVTAARVHWLATALLAVGLALRVLAMIAYHPALLYVDTLKYLYNAWPAADPLGYKIILKVILVAGDLGTVALIQHLLGLAIAIAIYALLVRRQVPRWLAAIAIAPVLFDAYQLQAEQTIMPDVWFEAFAVAGIVFLLWEQAPTVRAAVISGLILGSSALVRQIGEIVLLPALIYLIIVIPRWRQALRPAAALTIAFLVPIIGYSGLNYLRGEHFGLSSEGSIMGRIAASVDCATLKLAPAERPLCPTPSQQAYGADWLEHSRLSPLKHFPIPPGQTRNGIISAFDSAAETQQPLRIIGSYLRDTIRIFALTKNQVPGTTPISRWRFQAGYPVYPPEITLKSGRQIIVGVQVKTTQPFSFQPLNPAYGGNAQVDRPVAQFLRDYQLRGGYTPGPLLAIFTIAGLGGFALALALRVRARRRRGAAEPDDQAGPDDSQAGPDSLSATDSQAERASKAGRDSQASQVALACALFFTAAVGILAVSDIFEFSWRYQLPALVTLPPAGALGAWALWRARRRPAGHTPAP